MEKRHSSEKKASKSFTTQTTQPKFTKKVEPLTRNFWSNLIKLESDFYNKHFTATTLDELIQCYARAVEYYDTVKDEITSYFIFKIQDALATKKSLKLLIEETAKAAEKKNTSLVLNSSSEDASEKNMAKVLSEEKNQNNEVIEEHANEESSDEDENIDEEDPAVKEFAKKKKEYLKQRNRKAKASFSTMITQKQRFVNFFHKMETQKVNQKQDMHALINEFSDYSRENDDMIQEGLSKQKDRLRNLIEQRKQKSFMAQTLNSNSFYINNKSMLNFNDVLSRKDVSETNAFDDVLRELEDPDLAQFSAAGVPEVEIENVNEENVLQEKANRAKEPFKNTPKTVRSNQLFGESNSENISPVKEARELSPGISTAEGDKKSRVESDRENITPIRVLYTQYEKISSENVKNNAS